MNEQINDAPVGNASALSNLSYSAIVKLAAQAQAEIAARAESEKNAMRLRFRAEAEAAGFTIAELFSEAVAKTPARTSGRSGSGRSGNTRAAKYRNTDGKTWAGVGKRPTWLTEALAGGAKLEDFLIQ